MTDIPQHKPDSMQLRMLLLHTLDKLGPSTNMQLIAFMVENDLMNYFDLQDTLYRLQDNGQITRSPLANDFLVSLTEAGQQALRLFIGRTMDSQLSRVESAAQQYRARFQRERQLAARIEHDGGEEYHAVLEINEMQRPMLRIDISLPTSDLAQRYKDNWPQKAQAIYDAIVFGLGEEQP